MKSRHPCLQNFASASPLGQESGMKAVSTLPSRCGTCHNSSSNPGLPLCQALCWCLGGQPHVILMASGDALLAFPFCTDEHEAAETVICPRPYPWLGAEVFQTPKFLLLLPYQNRSAAQAGRSHRAQVEWRKLRGPGSACRTWLLGKKVSHPPSTAPPLSPDQISEQQRL